MIGSSKPRWSRETIARFWSFHSRNTSSEEVCFSNMFGMGLLTLLSELRLLRNAPRLLDYGCGSGHLLERLLPTGALCWGLDLSQEAVQVTNDRLSGKPGWQGAQVLKGAQAPFEDGHFDVVIGVEVIEHLLDEDLQEVLGEIRRLLRPGGAVMFTTPNDEDLTKNLVFCPFCETEFHSVQHVRSFSSQSLTHTLASHGFRVGLCTGVDLGWLQGEFPTSLWDWSPRMTWSWAFRGTRRFLDRLFDREFHRSFTFGRGLGMGPHLVALAEKPEEEETLGSFE